MDYVKIRAHVADHPRFIEAGAVARDLWTWGMIYSAKHESDGAIKMAALLDAGWGAGGKANVKVAAKLVEVGLWERTDAGFQICQWAEQGNVTKSELVEAREAARERMKRKRSVPPPPVSGVRANNDACSREHPPNIHRTITDVPTSTSLSSSGSGSPPDPRAPTVPPEWFAVDVVATVEMAGLRVDSVPARWLEYRASRERKGWAEGHSDAVGWLTTVLRSERSKAPAKSRPGSTVQPYDAAAPWMQEA